jgi:hypothetical protein
MFAVIVWYELREHRKELKAHRDDESSTRTMFMNAMATMTTTIAALTLNVEKLMSLDKVREMLKDEISGVHNAVSPRQIEDGDGDHTPPEWTPPRGRERERPDREAPTPNERPTPRPGTYNVTKRKGTQGG